MSDGSDVRETPKGRKRPPLIGPPRPPPVNRSPAATTATAATTSLLLNNDPALRQQLSQVLEKQGWEERAVSPFLQQHHRYASSRENNNSRTKQAFKQIRRVSRQAALQTKTLVWDSNETTVNAAVQVVDQWEGAYTALRACIVVGVHQLQRFYGAAKGSATQMEEGILRPVRDWILLPAFGGMEQATAATTHFLQSPAAHQVAYQVLQQAAAVPVVGENVLAPGLVFGAEFLQRTWQIVQYPIPSKQQVRASVEICLNTTKWVLTTGGREFVMFAKRADANISRTLSQTQWRVLGSGPYVTLTATLRTQVLEHLAERYLATADPVGRYEWMAHIGQQNAVLYRDLVGFMLNHVGEAVHDDEWLQSCPVYRHLQRPYFLPEEDESADDPNETAKQGALWFYQPSINGQPPSRESPWILFTRQEQMRLEARYRQVVQGLSPLAYGRWESNLNGEETSAAESGLDETLPVSNQSEIDTSPEPVSTMAHWYAPVETDVLVDQKRHCVTVTGACPRCWTAVEEHVGPPKLASPPVLCRNCQRKDPDWQAPPEQVGLPAYSARRRAVLWRFYGPGDAVRRSVWILDTPRNGLQPFDEEAAAILEDAYWFMQWRAVQQQGWIGKEDTASNLDDALLTVEVTCPDGTERLVQFSSLSRATAIHKGLGAALTIHKRRVYRGTWLIPESLSPTAPTVHESLVQSSTTANSDGAFDTFLPNVALRDVLTPSPVPSTPRAVTVYMSENFLAVPPLRFEEEDMARYWRDVPDGNIDHLCLIVHGIGEMLRSIDVFGLSLPNLSSIVDCCGYLRKNHAQVQQAHFAQMYPSAVMDQPGRVEYLPIEWHEAFAVQSQRRFCATSSSSSSSKKAVLMQDISLRTIPNMRDFANDTLMDVLYFMSPEHHDIMIDIVTREMNTVVRKFRELTGFTGRISLVGHSLGSILSYDILANQNIDLYVGDQEGFIPGAASVESLDTFVSAHSSEQSREEPEQASPGGRDEIEPEVTRPSAEEATSSIASADVDGLPRHGFAYPQLQFEVDNFFMLGSPVAVFLMIRNQQQPLREDCYLRGCHRVFNIFHPYDPIAYRIEPCVDPRNSEFEPTLMPHWNGGFRVQYKTRHLWRKLMDNTYKTQQNVVEAFEASMAGMGLLDTTSEAHAEEDTSASEASADESRSNYVVTGQLNQGRRIDYVSGDCSASFFVNHARVILTDIDSFFYFPHRCSKKRRLRAPMSTWRPSRRIRRTGLKRTFPSLWLARFTLVVWSVSYSTRPMTKTRTITCGNRLMPMRKKRTQLRRRCDQPTK
jgi:hypothetical protein